MKHSKLTIQFKQIYLERLDIFLLERANILMEAYNISSTMSNISKSLSKVPNSNVGLWCYASSYYTMEEGLMPQV